MDRKTLVENNWKLAPTFAKQFQGRGLPMEDMVQIAVLGIIRAAEDFDAAVGKFSTYAGHWARKFIRDSLRHDRAVDIPDYMMDMVVKYRHAENKLRQQFSRQPNRDEIVATIEFTPKQAEYVQYIDAAVASARIVSAQTAIGEDATVGDTIADNKCIDPSDREVTDVSKYLSVLSDRDAEIIKMRYGIGYPMPLTLDEVGRVMGGLTKERVRQIESKALKAMHALISKVCQSC